MMQTRQIFRFLLIFSIFFGLIGTSFAQGGVPTDPDPDNDGLTVDNDSCPNQAGPAFNDGCPVQDPEIPPDSDGDGTADPQDLCPNEAGDGANGGCPAGQTSPSTEPTEPTITLDTAPTEGDCVVSTGGTTGVNMRQSPTQDSAIIAVLPPNEWFNVLGVFSAPADLYNDAMAGAPAPFLDMFPSSMDASNETWYLVQKINEPITGWVAESVIRLGGECGAFNIAEKKKGGKKDQQAYMVVTMEEVLISSYSSRDDGEEEEDGIVIIAIIGVLIGMRVDPNNPNSDPTAAQADYYLLFDAIDGESSDNDHTGNFVRPDLLEEGCELTQDAAGIIMPSCEDGGMPSSLPICTHQELNEAGVFEEVCYNVEIPEGCVVDTSQAGRWNLSCDDMGEDGIQITPIGEEDPIIDIIWYDDNTVGIGLLLPAVQKVREAAARAE